MLEIVKDGIIETVDQLMELMKQFGQVVIPNEDEDLDLTHGSVVQDDGTERGLNPAGFLGSQTVDTVFKLERY